MCVSGLLCITALQILGPGTFWKQAKDVIWALEKVGGMVHWTTGNIGGIQCMMYFYIFLDENYILQCPLKIMENTSLLKCSLMTVWNLLHGMSKHKAGL